jgi:hypothetical protein
MKKNISWPVLGFCAGLASASGCASIPVAPQFDPLPPAVASLNLQIGGVEGPALQKLSAASLDEALRPALASALTAAGLHLVFDAETADAIIDVTVDEHVFVPAPYRTTLTLRGPRGREIDQVKFTGGTIGGNYNSTPEMFERLAHGIAYNLVAKLLKSPILLAFSDEPRSKRPTAGAAAAPVGAAEMKQMMMETMRELSKTNPGEASPETILSDVDRPGYRLAEDPGAFAVVVGVEKYSNELPAAQFAERDAQSVRNHLVALGYPERNIKLLTGSHAVRSALEAYLEDWLPKNVKEGGRVFFYFSGHGAPDPESGQAYLVPWDGNPNFLDKTAYPLKKLYVDLNALKAKRVIVALDSCFSGAGGRSVLAEGTRPLISKVDISVSADSKLLLFAAASPKEVTATLKEQGHGIFTYYFLKGLGGAAKNAGGVVTPRGLYDYLKPKVQDAANLQNRDQTPVLEGAAGSELVRF